MADETTTGGIDGVDLDTAGASSFLRNTKVQDSRCEAYDIPYEQSAVTRRSRTPAARKPDIRRAEIQAAKELRAARYALSVCLRRACAQSRRMHEAAMAGDAMGLAEAGFALSEELSKMWQLKQVREDQWGGALSFLQVALTREEFERFKPEQCAAVRVVIDEHLANGAVDDEDVVQVRRKLRRAGLDPWKGISASAESWK